MQHKLVAVVGNTPQVMTETFWALYIDRDVPIDEVYVITTTLGKETCQKRLLDEGRFEKMLLDYNIDPNTVAFGPNHIYVFEDAEGNFLDDIRTSDDNRIARDGIFELIETLTHDDQVALHCSLAGGRKSMGFILGAAIHFFGRPQDRLYHVLVSVPEIERSDASYYYPPEKPEPIMVFNCSTGRDEPLIVRGQKVMSDAVSIELANVPFCRLRDVVQFVAPGQYTEDTLRLTQQAVNDYAKQMQEQYIERVASGAENAFPEIIGQSDSIRDIKNSIRLYAPYDRSVLITGPTGSGKELVAAALHKASDRTGKSRPENCARLGDLAESQLFGYERGAFTNANKQYKGLFEQADGGTLFLDEINSLRPDIQGMLLRVMEDGEIRRMGSEKDIPVNVRLIAATNEDLNTEESAFRDDLLSRFSLTIEVPPLKDRREDIPLLAHHFLKSFSEHEGKEFAGFTEEAMHALQAHDWPSNIRGLKNAIDNAAIRTPENQWITPDVLFKQKDTDIVQGSFDEQVAQFEKKIIQDGDRPLWRCNMAVLYVTETGAQVRREGERLAVWKGKKKLHTSPRMICTRWSYLATSE